MDKKVELKETGESITFTKSASDANGQFAEAFVTLPSKNDGPPMHRHVLQSEFFEVIEGKLGIKCGDENVFLEPGQTFTVPANTPHSFYTTGDTAVKFKGSIKPALNIEYLLTELVEACNRNNAAYPSVYDACYIISQLKGEYYLAAVPVFIQHTIFPMMAGFGKLFGLVKARPKTA